MTQRENRPSVLSMVLAGGAGTRLMPLTDIRAKPAVPFGGPYRLIDFALSNLANGGYRKIVVLTQYKSHSLDVHISRTWRLSTLLGAYVTSVPAQMRDGERWFMGSADALFQNLNLIYDEKPSYIFVFGADHIYRMDPRQMLDHHIDSGAGVTIAALRTPRSEASEFGVIRTGEGSQILDFLEKPVDPPGLSNSPEECLTSMGNYVFSTDYLLDTLIRDADNPDSTHDIGGDLLPLMVDDGRAHVYDYTTNRVPGDTELQRGYWRDVGTIDAYHEAQMDLVSPLPRFSLYNTYWPIFTQGLSLPPAKFVRDDERDPLVVNSIVSQGAILSGCDVSDSVISPKVHLDRNANVARSILLDGVVVSEKAVVNNAIIDKNVVVPAGSRVGVDHEEDRSRGFTISDNGVVVVPKNYRF